MMKINSRETKEQTDKQMYFLKKSYCTLSNKISCEHSPQMQNNTKQHEKEIIFFKDFFDLI